MVGVATLNMYIVVKVDVQGIFNTVVGCARVGSVRYLFAGRSDASVDQWERTSNTWPILFEPK